MEPGAPHDLQARPRPVDGVTLPLLEVHLVYPAADHDEEVPLVPDEFFRSEVSLALLALPGGQVGRKFPSWRVRVVVSPGPELVLIILLRITEVKLVTATTVAITTSVVIS